MPNVRVEDEGEKRSLTFPGNSFESQSKFKRKKRKKREREREGEQERKKRKKRKEKREKERGGEERANKIYLKSVRSQTPFYKY